MVKEIEFYRKGMGKSMKKIIIVGGVAGGASAAARIRRLDEQAEIIMFERDGYISFANCGLPYYIGGDITDSSALTLQTPESFRERFNVDVRIHQEVMSIDRNQKQVEIKNLITSESYCESYDYLILSPGAVPLKPSIIGAESQHVFTLRNIPDTYRIKDYISKTGVKKAVIVGGGYIGIEMAESLYKSHVEVTIVEFANHVIGSLDYEMACDVHHHIRDKGIELILEDGVKEIRETGKNIGRTEVVLSDCSLITDMIILSVGVRPESKLAKEACLRTNELGAIRVNENMRTDDPFIYAVGDAVEIKEYITKDSGYIPLAGPANKQGRIAADNVCGIPSTYKGTQGTGILKCFDMTIATTGINETRAKQLGLKYEKSYTYSASHASYYPGAANMSIKIIFDTANGKLLGAQIVGYDGVDKRLDVFATAIRAGMTVYDLAELELAYAPPYSSAKDPVNMAGFTAENILKGRVQVFHWDQVDSLPQDGSVTLLDIRTLWEYEDGTIEGFKNISLDELRKHMDELDKSKPVYVTCQVGLRGYLASRILSQHGFKCYNLSGGYRLYNSVVKNGNTSAFTREVSEIRAAQLGMDEL